MQNCLATLRVQEDACPVAEEVSPCHQHFPLPSAPSTPATKRHTTHTSASPLEIIEVEEIVSDQELIPAPPPPSASMPYGKGIGRGANDARKSADPYGKCSPLTHLPQPALEEQPVHLPLAVSVPSVSQSFHQGAVIVATVQRARMLPST